MSAVIIKSNQTNFVLKRLISINNGILVQDSTNPKEETTQTLNDFKWWNNLKKALQFENYAIADDKEEEKNINIIETIIKYLKPCQKIIQ
jgi:hypothetical protein